MCCHVLKRGYWCVADILRSMGRWPAAGVGTLYQLFLYHLYYILLLCWPSLAVVAPQGVTISRSVCGPHKLDQSHVQHCH
jgi:hypothetical protein